MITRRISALLSGCILLLLLATPAKAGGWAVVTVDELPPYLQAGVPMTLGFIVRQHGQHPVNLEHVVLTATHLPKGETLTFTARQDGPTGHYVVEVLLPKAGNWDWSIQPDWFAPLPLLPLTVLETRTSLPSSLHTLLPWGVTGLGALVLGSKALWPHASAYQPYTPPTLLGVSLVIGRLGWLGLGAQLPSPATPVQPEPATYGRALFMAKGCNSCHLHDAALNTWSTEIGPNLTAYQKTTEYLRIWLKDPQAIKPNTAMPNLQLNADEIEALAAFLTQAQP